MNTKNDTNIIMSNDKREIHLEPRVAKLEVGLDRLTDDVRNLASVVRDQGQQMEQEIQKLVVAVTQAAGPKKTDWQTIIAGLGLIFAIGAAVFYPLNQQVQELKIQQSSYQQSISEHSKLDSHPVGSALVQRLEEQLKTHISNNEKEFKRHIDEDAKEFETSRIHYHEELAFLKENLENQLKAAKDRNDQFNDKIYNRVVKLEEQNALEYEKDRSELMKWRQKAMGLSSPDAVVPLVTRDNLLHPQFPPSTQPNK